MSRNKYFVLDTLKVVDPGVFKGESIYKYLKGKTWESEGKILLKRHDRKEEISVNR